MSFVKHYKDQSGQGLRVVDHEDEGTIILRNIGKYLSADTITHPRRFWSSAKSLSLLQTSHIHELSVQNFSGKRVNGSALPLKLISNCELNLVLGSALKVSEFCDTVCSLRAGVWVQGLIHCNVETGSAAHSASTHPVCTEMSVQGVRRSGRKPDHWRR